MQLNSNKIFFSIYFLMLFSTTADAINLDLLLMPGKVIKGHAEYEEKCEACHEKLRKENQDKKCLGCHDHSDIEKDIKKRTGFHGKTDKIREQPCKHCHTEHKGRDAKIVHFDEETFEHIATDYELKGAHLAVACQSCHPKEKKFSQAPNVCIDCHKKDEPHKTQLGEKCEACHTETSWNEFKFNHSEKTEFELTGKHKEVSCNLCHPGERYKETPQKCVSCHKINDSHTGRYGDDCETCHNSEGWDQILFDHDRKTKFRITGKHKRAKCDNCHKNRLYEQKLDQKCNSCHRRDDTHKGQNGENCEKCHSTNSWDQASFDHKKDTKFPLAGRHAEIACRACHRGEVTEEHLDTKCIACHQDDDVHLKKAGDQCQRCHDQIDWGQNIFFDHGLTSFPLLGQHATSSCEECHLTSVFKDTPSACEDCHQKDDIHEKNLGIDCANCHNPNDWQLWLFDHNNQTEFGLDGKHEGLDCLACHTVPLEKDKKPLDQCVSCHRKNDVHEGAYGNTCDRCHTTESFLDITMMRKP